MKRLIYISSFILISFILNSCKDYTEDYPVPEASIVIKFSMSEVDELVFPVEISFTNESVIPERAGTSNFEWIFGDGENSADESPVHEFTNPGLYNVKLIAHTEVGDYETSTEIDLRGALFEEDFDDITVIPEDWVLINVDGNTPSSSSIESLADSAFIVYYSSYFGSNVALGVSYYNPDAAADDWMILPKVSLGQNSILSWEAMSMTSSGSYPDSYQVYVSTTTQDIAGCEANGVILNVTDEEVGDDVGGAGISKREIDLSQFAGQEVYVAFRLMTPYPGGDRLAIDNIKIVEPE